MFRLLVGIYLASLAAAIEFSCDTLLPQNTDVTEAADSEHGPYVLQIIDDHGNQAMHPAPLTEQQNIRVKVIGRPSTLSFSSFILVARLTGTSGNIGTWMTDDRNAHAARCDGTSGLADFVTHANYEPKVHIVAHWTVPILVAGSRVEFVATVANSSRVYWTDIHSIQLGSATTSAEHGGVDSEEDPHNQRKESVIAADIRQHQQDLVDAEDRESEGEWQKEAERQRQEHEQMMEWEARQYEVQLQQEEHQREERIRLEILDMEEHSHIVQEENQLQLDRLEHDVIDMTENELCKLTATCGAGSLVVPLVLLYAAIAMLLQ